MKDKSTDNNIEKDKNVPEHFDFPQEKSPGQPEKRVHVDFPEWMLRLLDWEASRVGVPRQSLIKSWIAEKLEKSIETDR